MQSSPVILYLFAKNTDAELASIELLCKLYESVDWNLFKLLDSVSEHAERSSISNISTFITSNNLMIQSSPFFTT